MLATAVLSRTRAARKNVVSSCCSTGGELHASAMRIAPASTGASRIADRTELRDMGPPRVVDDRGSLLLFVLLSKAGDRDCAIVAFDVDQANALRGTSDCP